MNSQVTNVGIAETGIAKRKGTLKVILGSCVGVLLYDKKSKIIGISHIMLGEQKNSLSNPKKYADTAIDILIQEMEEEGANASNMEAKLFGGAKMFSLPDGGMMANIGVENIKQAKKILERNKIKVVAEDTGGVCGRTVEFDASSGRAVMKKMGSEPVEF